MQAFQHYEDILAPYYNTWYRRDRHESMKVKVVIQPLQYMRISHKDQK